MSGASKDGAPVGDVVFDDTHKAMTDEQMQVMNDALVKAGYVREQALTYPGLVDPAPGTTWFGLDGRKATVLGTMYDGKSTVLVEVEPAGGETLDELAERLGVHALAKAIADRYKLAKGKAEDEPTCRVEFLVDGQVMTEEELQSLAAAGGEVSYQVRRVYEHAASTKAGR